MEKFPNHKVKSLTGCKMVMQDENKRQEAILLDAENAARLCGLSQSTWQRLSNAGRVPAPIKLGRRSLWSRVELESWAAMGCPNREQWNRMKTKGYDLLYRQSNGCMCLRKEA